MNYVQIRNAPAVIIFSALQKVHQMSIQLFLEKYRKPILPLKMYERLQGCRIKTEWM